MTCTNCGATIADKAIVCYRCGTATAIPERPAAVKGSPPSGRGWGLSVVLLILALLAAWEATAVGDRRWEIGLAAAAALLGIGALLMWLRRGSGRR